MTIAHIDFETYSELNVNVIGTYAYAAHPSTEILCAAFVIDDQHITHLWIPRSIPAWAKETIQSELRGKVQCFWFGSGCPAELSRADEFRAHNAEFERVVGNYPAGEKVGFPFTSPARWTCTAAKAAAYGMPRGLGKICEALGTENQKDETGRNAMLQVSRPRDAKKGTRWDYSSGMEKYLATYAYCVDDVLCEREIDQKLSDLQPTERKIWQLDQRINERGVKVDVMAVENGIYLVERYKDKLARKCEEITGLRPTQTQKLAEWVRKQDYAIPDLQAPTIRDCLAGKTPLGRPSKRVGRVLMIRARHEMKAVSKLQKMLEAKSADDRLRGMLLYHAASTGRWGGKIVQLQNLFRSKIKDPETAIELFRSRDLELVQALYAEDPMLVFASTIRGMLIADDGRRLISGDLSAIEARITAWHAGQEDKLAVYRTHGLAYEYTAAKMFRPGKENDLDYLRIMKEHEPGLRFRGKTAELALGFQGAVGALQRMAKKEGVDVPEEEALETVQEWRSANSEIVRFWYDLDEHAKEAVRRPGQIFQVGRIMFKLDGDWLYMRLPSGRKLAYYKPVLMDGHRGDQLTYMGIDTHTRQWTRVRTYGGRLCVAGETEILTRSRGWIRLDSYREGEELWDGVEWVNGGKLVDQGVSSVIEYAGVRMTKDHRVLTEQGWKTASQSQRLAWQEVRLPDNLEVLSQQRRQNVLARSMRLWNTLGCARRWTVQKARAVAQVLRLSDPTTDLGGPNYARHVQASGFRSLAKYAWSLSAPNTPGISQLRWAGDHGLQAVERLLRELLERYETYLPAWAYTGSAQKRQKLYTRKLPMGLLRRAGQQSQRAGTHLDSTGKNVGITCSTQTRAESKYSSRADTKRMERQAIAATRVYDILDVGLRKRFTVRGQNGEIMLVHNCENAVQATARDILRDAMVRLEARGYTIILTVHDEILCEEELGEGTVEEVCALMAEVPTWAKGLPVRAEGWEGQRYRKE